MLILVADRSESVGRLLGDMLEADGHQVHVAGSGAAARGLLNKERWDLLILDAGLTAPTGLELLRLLRQQTNPVPAFLTVDQLDSRTLQVGELLRAELYGRPFNAFTLTDRVRSIAPPPPAAAPPAEPLPGGNSVEENLRLLTELWSQKSSGLLRLTVAGVERQAEMGEGGPVGIDAINLVRESLRDGSLRFQKQEVDRSGSRMMLGDLLYQRAQELATRVPVRDGSVLHFNLRAIEDLPIASVMRSSLRSTGGHGSLAMLAQRGFSSEADLRSLLQALVVMGLAGENTGNSHTRELLGEPPPAPARKPIPDSFRSTSRPTVDRVGSALPGSQSSEGGFHSQPGSALSSRHVRTIPARNQVSFPERSTTSVDRRSSLSYSSLSERPFSSIADPPATRSIEPVVPGAGPAPSMGKEQLVSMLRREGELLREASPWMVLGIQPGSPDERIERAGARMLQRYADLVRHPDAEVSALARRVLRRVEEAHKQLRERIHVPEEHSEEVGPDEAHFLQGKAAAAKQAWAVAEQHFSRARDL
ncbi:MAG TPA: response regulator, partial [Myxococcota bacterium]|nr:response regulator [Myxococcota bacterium]